MNKIMRGIRKYPLVAVFFVFLIGFAFLDGGWPKRAHSALENRSLAQYPILTLEGIKTNKWMQDYEAYVKDQFAFRDTWIDLKSLSETALLKTENNGILLGNHHYLFKKVLAIDEKQFGLNLSALGKFADRHPGKVEVMVVPSASLILQDKLPLAAPLANENAFLDDIRTKLEGKAHVYDMRDTLSNHSKEYIYYRTDHHWTTDGAYYVYEAYTQSKALAGFDILSATPKTVPQFYGTHYSSARNLGVVPDTITYYDLPNALNIYTMDQDGKRVSERTSLYDIAKFDTRDKYAAFLHGNNGYSEVQGTGTGNLLVVKDSYANAFIPFLVQDYEKIGVVDYRQNKEKLDSIMANGNYNEVLFLYSFDGFSTDASFASKIATASS